MKTINVLVLSVLFLLNALCIEGFIWPWKKEESKKEPAVTMHGDASIPSTEGIGGGAPLPPSEEEPQDAMHTAASRGDIKTLEFLLSKHISINDKDRNGWQPIHEAVKHGDVNVVKFLVDHGSELGERTTVGGTPLWWSDNYNGEDHPVSIYLRDINAPYAGDAVSNELEAEDIDTNTDGSTDLHMLASEGNVDAAEQLLHLHPHLINAIDSNGWQPLHEAVLAGELEMTKFLMISGAELSAKTVQGGTPLWWARRTHGSSHPVTIYLEHSGAVEEGVNL